MKCANIVDKKLCIWQISKKISTYFLHDIYAQLLQADLFTMLGGYDNGMNAYWFAGTVIELIFTCDLYRNQKHVIIFETHYLTNQGYTQYTNTRAPIYI